MAIFKGFRVQIVDGKTPSANVIEDLGECVLPILSYKASAPTGLDYRPGTGYFSNYTDDYLSIGSCNLSGDPLTSNFQNSFAKLLIMAPLTVDRSLYTHSYQGNYVRLYNAAGTYIVNQSPLGVSGTASLVECHYPDGNSFNQTIFSFEYGFPNSMTRTFSIVAEISGDNVVNVKQYYEIWGFPVSQSDVRWYAQVTNINNSAFVTWLNTCKTYVEPAPDPYNPAGDSGPGGFDGTFDYTGNPPDGWDPTNPPGLSALSTGFVTLYNPTTAELQALAQYLWSNSFDLDLFKKIFNDPMDLFIGLSIIPVAVPDGARRSVGIGLIDTEVYMTTAGAQYIPVDCGSVVIDNFTGGYLDYSPYTRVDIFLPYIGTRTLNIDEIMGHTLHVGYWVDILSGACTAWLDVDGSAMYQYMGQCATAIPMASGEWTNLINGIIGAIGSVAAGAVAGGVGGAIAGGVASASAVAVNDGKVQVERSGAITSAAGLMGMQKPVLYFSAPNLHKPFNQSVFEGYPAYFTEKLSNMTGYTSVERIRLQGIPATEPELQEIETLLKEGVIL